jgi:hypothetical protein
MSRKDWGNPRARASERRTKRGKDAGRPNSSAIWPTEDAAPRRVRRRWTRAGVSPVLPKGLRRQAPALLVACIALVAALGGTVYAKKTKVKVKIDGRAVKVKSLPGNRLAMGSVPGNRLKPGAITGSMLAPGSVPANALAPGSITGIQVDASTLGQVPSAVHADSADSARDAQTALNAVNAIDAEKVNGHTAGCRPPARFFAGACWQSGSSEAAVSAPVAAQSCATQGGELPEALALAAFSQQPGIALAAGDEWTSDLATYTAVNAYSVATISATAELGAALSTSTKKYRCVIPLLS